MKHFTISGSKDGRYESNTIKCHTEGEARMVANNYFGSGKVSTVNRDYFSDWLS